jgi:hypothetical protein
VGDKLLHVLIDFCGQSAKFIRAHGVLAQTVASTTEAIEHLRCIVLVAHLR